MSNAALLEFNDGTCYKVIFTAGVTDSNNCIALIAFQSA